MSEQELRNALRDAQKCIKLQQQIIDNLEASLRGYEQVLDAPTATNIDLTANASDVALAGMYEDIAADGGSHE